MLEGGFKSELEGLYTTRIENLCDVLVKFLGKNDIIYL
jgi:hypothetical protein